MALSRSNCAAVQTPGQGTRLDAAHTAPESQRQVLPPGFLHLTRKHVRTDTVVHHPRMCARVRVRKYVHEASYSIAGHAFSTATRDCNPRPPPCDIRSRTRILSVKPHAQTQHMGRQLGSTARVRSRQPGGSHSCRSVSPGGAVGPSGCSVCPHRTASEQPACCHDNHQRGLSCPRDILAQCTGMALAFALCDALSCPHAEHDAT